MSKKNKILINISIVSLLIFLNIYGKINEETITNYLIDEQSSEHNKAENFYNNITNVKSLIYNLNLFINQTRQTNVIFADYFLSKVCYDKSAFTLFEYYLNENIDIPYYIVNIKSEFYMSLLKQNKTKNLILFNPENMSLFYKNLFYYLKDAKIIVNAYTIHFLQIIAGNVPYIKFLKINHGIKYFKVIYAKTEFNKALGKKKNAICSSPYEYELITKYLSPNQIHNASLVRYARFENIKKNESEKKCILASFTYRTYNKYIFKNSIYKKNMETLLNDDKLISVLSNKNIDLIYIPHHEEIDLGKKYFQSDYKYAKIKNQNSLEHYIEQCSLFITDFSSISFDFMFQNKAVLFYSIDKNDSSNIIEKQFMRESNDIIYFGNQFSNKDLLIDKIIYYINNGFIIDYELRKKYESVFFLKVNIIKRIVEIINNIVKSKIL